MTLNVNGGDALPMSEFIVTYDQPYNCLPNASRTGYTFIGWFENETGGNQVTNTTIVKTPNNHTLYAHWAINNYIITFNYGNGTVDSKTLKYNETIIYPENLTREGYTFNGWEPKPERMPADDTIVVAQWTANNYTVTLNVNSGDVLPTSEFIVTYDQPYNCLPNAPRTGYTFIGWFTSASGGIEVTNKTTANITADNHTLYAHWTINNYTITFDFGNGTNTSTEFAYNETINYPVNLTREGYTFNGWEPKPVMMPAEDTTVVAQWIENATSEVIKIVFSKKDMTKEEVFEIIKEFTKENFTIKEFGVNENGSLVVIIRFDDETNAKNFVDAIAASDNSNELFIESISFLSEPLQDMATGLQLPSIFGLFHLFLFSLALF